MIKGKEDITDKEFEEILLPFYNNYNEYLINFVIPDTIAFYLANGHSRKCLSDCWLRLQEMLHLRGESVLGAVS